MRIVAGPVSANLTGTTSPTTRWSLLAVVVSMSRPPLARAAGVPEVIRRIRVLDRSFVETAVSVATACCTSNSPVYTVEDAVTPGSDAAACDTVLLKPPAPPDDDDVTMRLALMALSMLLVADFASEAPKTATAEISARPTMSADEVCAVRRGLRIEGLVFAGGGRGALDLPALEFPEIQQAQLFLLGALQRFEGGAGGLPARVDLRDLGPQFAR